MFLSKTVSRYKQDAIDVKIRLRYYWFIETVSRLNEFRFIFGFPFELSHTQLEPAVRNKGRERSNEFKNQRIPRLDYANSPSANVCESA